MTDPFTDNPDKSRFEYIVNGSIAFANYTREGSKLYIDYVEAPPELRGTGAAGHLMQSIMSFAQKEHLKVIPKCAYAAAWIKKNRPPPARPLKVILSRKKSLRSAGNTKVPDNTAFTELLTLSVLDAIIT